ncbi:hypothetical protein D3C76_1854060 [compost metagenome]
MRIGLDVRLGEIETIRKRRGLCNVVDGDVVFATFHAGQQITGICHDKVGANLQFVGQQLAQLDFEAL